MSTALPYVNHFIKPNSFNWTQPPLERTIKRVAYLSDGVPTMSGEDMYWSIYRRSAPVILAGFPQAQRLAKEAAKGRGHGDLLEELGREMSHVKCPLAVCPLNAHLAHDKKSRKLSDMGTEEEVVVVEEEEEEEEEEGEENKSMLTMFVTEDGVTHFPHQEEP